MLPCRVQGVVLLVVVGPCLGVEFGVPLVVEQRDVSENLEFLHHVAPVSVQFVDVFYEPCDVVGHGGQFQPGELVVPVCVLLPSLLCCSGSQLNFRRSCCLVPQRVDHQFGFSVLRGSVEGHRCL